jgi:putative transposase
LLVTQIDALREAVRRVRTHARFHIDAWVVFPDHMHCPWTLPGGRCRFPWPLARDQERVFEIGARL